MADFQVLGHISVIKYLPECILIYVDDTNDLTKFMHDCQVNPIQTINRASYPRTTIKTEKKMIKESQEHANEKPNLEEYENPDF